ncbi:MAG TPA: carbohydrate kinase family protein [Longimicrobiaceae bacterium]
MRRLGAIGTLVWDRIVNPYADNGQPREQWGGAVYSFASLSAACPAGWCIEPLVKIGADFWERGVAHLTGLPNVVHGPGLVRVDSPNNRVELLYHDLEHRVERQLGGVPAWTWEELEPLIAGVDALYVNFLSGIELDLPTAQRLRAAFPGPIYADLHSLFLGPASNEPRRPRPLERWQEWLRCFDAIQLNEDELALLAPEVADRDCLERQLPCYGPGLVLVTEGGKGVRYVMAEGMPADPLLWRSRPAGSEIRRGEVPAPQGRLAGDPTGCGDVWGAGFITGLLAGLELEEAIVRAERLAATKILHPRTDRLHERLADTVDRT